MWPTNDTGDDKDIYTGDYLFLNKYYYLLLIDNSAVLFCADPAYRLCLYRYFNHNCNHNLTSVSMLAIYEFCLHNYLSKYHLLFPYFCNGERNM